MSLTFADITAGIRLAGVVPNAAVTVVAPQVHGPESATLTHRRGERRPAPDLGIVLHTAVHGDHVRTPCSWCGR